MNIILYLTSPVQALPFISAFINFMRSKKKGKINLFIFTRNIYLRNNLKDLIKNNMKIFLNEKKLEILFLPLSLMHIFCFFKRFNNNSFFFLPTFHLGPILTILISQAKCISFGEGFGYHINTSPGWAKPLPFQWRFIFKNERIKNIAPFNLDINNSITFNKKYISDYFGVVQLMKKYIKDVLLSSDLLSKKISLIKNIFVMSALAEKNGRINLSSELKLYYEFIIANSEVNSVIGIYSHPRHDKKFIKKLIHLLNSKNIVCLDLRDFFSQNNLSSFPIELILNSLKEELNKNQLSIKVFQQSAIFLTILGLYENLEIGFQESFIKRFFNEDFILNRIKYESKLKEECEAINKNIGKFKELI